jgi:hypothetical protein
MRTVHETASSIRHFENGVLLSAPASQQKDAPSPLFVGAPPPTLGPLPPPPVPEIPPPPPDNSAEHLSGATGEPEQRSAPAKNGEESSEEEDLPEEKDPKLYMPSPVRQVDKPSPPISPASTRRRDRRSRSPKSSDSDGSGGRRKRR